MRTCHGLECGLGVCTVRELQACPGGCLLPHAVLPWDLEVSPQTQCEAEYPAGCLSQPVHEVLASTLMLWTGRRSCIRNTWPRKGSDQT